MGGFRKRFGEGLKPNATVKPHKQQGIIAPQAKDPIYGLDPEMLKPKPMSGGKSDTDRVRLIRNFYSELPEGLFIYQELVEEIPYDFALDKRFDILIQDVPDDRTFVVDNVEFFATPLFGTGLIPAGTVEGAVQAYFQIGNVIPVEIRTTRVQPGLPAEDRAYFPFFNDRVGAREVNFSLYAKRGRELRAYYINRAFAPVPLRTIGVRIEGWMVDSNALEEILEQQR